MLHKSQKLQLLLLLQQQLLQQQYFIIYIGLGFGGITFVIFVVTMLLFFGFTTST